MKKTRSKVKFVISFLLVLSLLLSIVSSFAQARDTTQAPSLKPENAMIIGMPAPLGASNWCVAGSFQGWNNASHPLYDDGTHGDLVAEDGVYSLDYTIPDAGDYEWKAVECGNWGVAFPAANSWFSTSQANQLVKLTFETNDHGTDAGVILLPSTNAVNVQGDTLPTSFTAVGDFQSWNNADPNTLMEALGNGIHRLAYVIPSPGSYIGKVASTGSWRAFGADGRSLDAANISFTTTAENQIVIFLLDTYTGRLVITSNESGVGNWCVAGGFQGWDNASTPLYDDGSHGDLIGGDGVFSLDYIFTSAGRYEFKAVECGNWDNAFPSSNAWVIAASDNQSVKLIFDTNDHSADAGWSLVPTQNIVNAWDSLPASFNAVGSFNGWNNADPAATMTDLGNALQMASYQVADTGNYEGKITETGTWDNQFGADGRSINGTTVNFQVASANDLVQFLLDTRQGRIAVIAPEKAGHGQDNNVEYFGLGHNSQDSLYRVPFGAINPDDELILRFRTYHNDVTRVRVRFYDTATRREFLRDMNIAASDLSCYDEAQPEESCDYWQIAYSPSELTTLYYRFIIYDGTAVAYYADDSFKDGGWGVATPNMVDNSYAVTVYDPEFQPVPWMKDAVAYQIFPDRFRNEKHSNDPSGNESRYRYPDEPLDQIVLKEWNDLPEGYCRFYENPAEPCDEGPRGRDYFGGDLVGIRNRIPYLRALGVKVIYLNPIFDAASNHAYDTQDYYKIDPFFGNRRDFQSLVTAAHQAGMKIILDGVFNHVSSDSPYFDRYGHFKEVGACESLDSPYRDWFTFREVAPGTGTCVGQDGANSANYDGWFGFDSLPVLNKNNPEVVDLIYATNRAVARFWLQAGADGWRLDVMPDPSFPPGFWQEFRQAVLDENPNAIIIGELWKKGDVLPLIQGDQADTTMNYRFRNAILGFFGKIDNKGFPDDGQSNQPPSLFARKLMSIREDYPDATYYTLLNLMDSHDTQRILWSLTPGANNREEKEFNQSNLEMGKQMLRLAAVVQMTIPGAPTIYYGDEVGVTGDDDPDDRRTFPWQGGRTMVIADTVIEPNTTVIQPNTSEEFAKIVDGPAGDLNLLIYYRMLTKLRNNRAVFRDGALSFLLTDDDNRTMAYLMRTMDDLAVVAVNRNEMPQTLVVDVTGKMPDNVQLYDVLGGLKDVSAIDGVLTFELPALSAAILLPMGGQDLVVPVAPTNLVAVAGNGQVDLSWDGVDDAVKYAIYRSPVIGGGYQLIGMSQDSAYTDIGVVNGKRYYYVAQAIDAAGNYGAFSNEAAATPFFPIGWAALWWPATIEHTLSVQPTQTIYGQVWVPGVTDSGGDPGSILAQVGFGTPGSDSSAWTTWVPMQHNPACDCGNNYEYMGNLRPEQSGVFDYLVRFSSDGGLNWTYGYWRDDPSAPGVLTVNPNPDVTPPASTTLEVTDWSANYIDLSWEPISDAAEYWLYRATAGGGDYGNPLAKITAPTTTYRDDSVDTGIEYFYIVRVVDEALNLSEPSNEVSQVAEPKLVDVTFRVRVPDETPPTDTVYLPGNIDLLGPWDPGKQPMKYMGDGIWEVTLQILDGTNLEYKYTRGNWDRVEWWGSIVSVANRSVTISYGADGTQLVDNTATNWGDGLDSEKAVQYWRDPLVVSTTPADGYTGQVPGDVTVIFSRPIQPLANSDFSNSVVVELDGVNVPGTISSPDNLTLVWTPDQPLSDGNYQVMVFNVRSDLGGDSVPMQSAYIFTFTVSLQANVVDGPPYIIRLPIVIKP